MIHFLGKREDERAQENQVLKNMVKELRDTHKQDVKTQTNLLKSIDKLPIRWQTSPLIIKSYNS